LRRRRRTRRGARRGRCHAHPHARAVGRASGVPARAAGVSAQAWWRVAVRRAWHGFMRHRGIDAAAALTFFSLLALLPGSLAVVSVFAIFDDRDRAVDALAGILDTVLPDQAAEDLEGVLRELLSLNNPFLALGIAIVLLLWTTSGYATAFGRATN